MDPLSQQNHADDLTAASAAADGFTPVRYFDFVFMLTTPGVISVISTMKREPHLLRLCLFERRQSCDDSRKGGHPDKSPRREEVLRLLFFYLDHLRDLFGQLALD